MRQVEQRAVPERLLPRGERGRGGTLRGGMGKGPCIWRVLAATAALARLKRPATASAGSCMGGTSVWTVTPSSVT